MIGYAVHIADDIVELTTFLKCIKRLLSLHFNAPIKTLRTPNSWVASNYFHPIKDINHYQNAVDSLSDCQPMPWHELLGLTDGLNIQNCEDRM